MNTKDTLSAWVHTLRHEAQDIISIELRPAAGASFPAFTPGAHIDLHLPGGLVRSYSLCNDAASQAAMWSAYSRTRPAEADPARYTSSFGWACH